MFKLPHKSIFKEEFKDHQLYLSPDMLPLISAAKSVISEIITF